MNDKPEIKPQGVSPLKRMCMTIGELPTSYLETMTYYEMLVWFTKFLQEKVIPAVDKNAEALKELQGLFIELQSYVNNYFDNLDVQDEIDHKLDEMAESGQLTDIIAQYLGLAGMIAFDTVADMKLAENLVNGSKCRTLGFHTLNDGGGAYYKIRQVTNNDVIDEATIIAVYDDLLVAELIAFDEVNIKQLGAYGDGSHDDVNAFKSFTSSTINRLIVPNGIYSLSDVLTFNSKEIIGIGEPELRYDSQTTSREHYIVLNSYFKIENITFNQKVHGTDVVGVFDCSYSQFKNCKFIANGYQCGSELDLYTNNHDILIDNCYFKLKSYNSSNVIQEGGIWVREHIAASETYNITFNDCVIDHDSKDEIIAVWNWYGEVHDVQLNNCKLIGQSTNTAPWFITFNVENSSMNNCYIENKRTTQFSGMFHPNENIVYKTITINNCIIKSHAKLINGFSTFALTCNNCYIYNDTTDNVFLITFNTKLNNCYIEANKLQFNSIDAYNCKFKGNGSDITYDFILMTGYDTLNLINCKFDNFKQASGMFIHTFNDCESIIIKNCIFNIDLTSASYFVFSNNTITNLDIENCNIDKGIYLGGTAAGVIANNITKSNISATSNVKVNNNFNINA